MLNHLDANNDVCLGWAYWAAGPWWGEDIFTLEPKDGVDRPQMTILANHMRGETSPDGSDSGSGSDTGNDDGAGTDTDVVDSTSESSGGGSFAYLSLLFLGVIMVFRKSHKWLRTTSDSI